MNTNFIKSIEDEMVDIKNEENYGAWYNLYETKKGQLVALTDEGAYNTDIKMATRLFKNRFKKWLTPEEVIEINTADYIKELPEVIKNI